MVKEILLVFQDGLNKLLQSIKDKDADKVSVGLASTLDTIAQLELLQVFVVAFKYPRFMILKLDAYASTVISKRERERGRPFCIILPAVFSPVLD